MMTATGHALSRQKINCRVCQEPIPRGIGRPRKLCRNADCLRADERRQYRQRYQSREFADPLDLTDADPQMVERFWSKVDVRGPDECWPWKRSTKGKVFKYGQFTVKKHQFMPASRVALALTKGPLAKGQVARHTCDNPPCCNPRHLLPGTQRQNAQDCIDRNRANRALGERQGAAKLTDSDVRAIRSTPITYGVRTQLARRYGVSFPTINKVLSGQRWGHVR